jgi:hypothetical protein
VRWGLSATAAGGDVRCRCGSPGHPQRGRAWLNRGAIHRRHRRRRHPADPPEGKLAGYDVGASGLGQNGWGEGYLGGYNTAAAVLAELVATFLFTLVILRWISGKGAIPFPGLVIGLTPSFCIFPS